MKKMTQDVRQCQEKEVADHKNKKKAGRARGRRVRGKMYQLLCLGGIKLNATNISKILTTVQHDPHG